MDVGLIAVCRRADVSSVLVALKDDGANIVYVEAWLDSRGRAISKNSADGLNWPPLPITILMRLFFGKAVRVPAQIEDS